MTRPLLAGTAGLIFLCASCTQYQQRGAGVGALGGAALGAIAGNDSSDVVRGAALGAAVGTGVAALQENQRRQADVNGSYGRDRRGYSDPEVPDQGRVRDYPVAERTEIRNRVLSPYPPYNVIDVSGFRSGDKARDPSNQKIFIVP